MWDGFISASGFLCATTLLFQLTWCYWLCIRNVLAQIVIQFSVVCMHPEVILINTLYETSEEAFPAFVKTMITFKCIRSKRQCIIQSFNFKITTDTKCETKITTLFHTNTNPITIIKIKVIL